MGIRKRPKKTNTGDDGQSNNNRNKVIKEQNWSSRTGLILFIAIAVFFFHWSYLSGLFENDRYFSHLSTVEREISFRTEMGLYYSYYKTLVRADSVFDGLHQLTRDNVTEYPSTINILQRFNIYPEVILGLAYRGYSSVLSVIGLSGLRCNTVTRGYGQPPVQACNGLGDPVYFYVWCVFALNGLLPSAMFVLSAQISGSVLGGCVSLMMLLFNHGECTRVMWTPPLRESFALPFFYLQLTALSAILCSRQPTSPRTYLWLTLSTLYFLVPWQFAPLALLTQSLSLMVLHSIGLLSANKYTAILLALTIAFAANVLLQFGNTLLISSFFPASILAGLVMSVVSSSKRSLLRGAVDVFVGLGLTVLIKAVVSYALGYKDDTHIATLLLSKLTSYKDFHTQLYSCSQEFDFLPLNYLLKVSVTFLLPIALVVMATVVRKMFSQINSLTSDLSLTSDPYLPVHVYHVLQCVWFVSMALLVMRLKVFLTPHLVILAGLVVNIKVLPRYVVLLVCLFSAIAGLYNMSAQWNIIGEFNSPEQEELVTWVNSATNQNAVFAGAMPTMATIKLCTGRPIVNHPHYEDAGLRRRTKLVYTVYSRKPSAEVWTLLTSLGTSHVIIEGAWCHKSYTEGCSFGAVWDGEDPVNKGRPLFCESVENGVDMSEFKTVFSNNAYTVLELVN